jgi:hypothetical protein
MRSQGNIQVVSSLPPDTIPLYNHSSSVCWFCGK